MKKILICLLTLSFFMDAQQSVNAVRNVQNMDNSLLQNEEPSTDQDDDNNGKPPEECEIDVSVFNNVESEFLVPFGFIPNKGFDEFANNIITPIKSKVKKNWQ